MIWLHFASKPVPKHRIAVASNVIKMYWAKTNIVWDYLHWIRRDEKWMFETGLTIFSCLPNFGIRRQVDDNLSVTSFENVLFNYHSIVPKYCSRNLTTCGHKSSWGEVGVLCFLLAEEFKKRTDQCTVPLSHYKKPTLNWSPEQNFLLSRLWIAERCWQEGKQPFFERNIKVCIWCRYRPSW